MARKKEKITVKLDLPKDDSTLTKLYAILGVSIFFGLICFTFWITNSHFTTSPNGQPLFVNTVCIYEMNHIPTFADNESCSILKDEPDVLVMEPEDSWVDFKSLGQMFDVPGMDENISDVRPPQPLVGTCSVTTSAPSAYSFIINDPQGVEIAKYDGISLSKDEDNCKLKVENMEPGSLYQVIIISAEPVLDATYRLEMEYFDGVPENMNNQSQWIGPEVDLGGLSLRPTIFLNFFGLGFFITFWPASYYWDSVKVRINRMEEKFPDFLRDLAEYWKGGLSMTVAVQTLATSEYGALNDEVKKMSDQLSWGVSFGDVIEMFAVRVGTPLVMRAISLISEANRAGGKISDILVTAANDSREIKFLEGERKRTIASYISVIWTSYGVFLGVIVVLAKVFIPAIAGSNSEPSTDLSLIHISEPTRPY